MPAVRRYRLPVAAAVAATMESATATAVESATTAVEPGVAMKAAANVAVAVTVIAVAAASIIAMAVVAAPIVAVSVVAMTPVVRSVPAVEPGAGADEEAVHEVVRAVEAVGRAGVRIIAVVAIGADRGGTNANADTNADLRVGTACGEEQNS